MSENTPAGLQTPARVGEQLRNTRVTAKIVREEDGTQRRVYRAQGRKFPTVSALTSALKSNQ